MFLCRYTHLKADFTRLNMSYSFKKHHLKNFQGKFFFYTMEICSDPFFLDQQDSKIYLLRRRRKRCKTVC